MACVFACFKEANASCSPIPLPPKQVNPNPGAGSGKLSKCCGCPGKSYCAYGYDNGDTCYYYMDTGQWRCSI
jgi:hypothetical protein